MENRREALMKLLANNDMNMSALAQLCGKSRTTITSWAKGGAAPNFTPEIILSLIYKMGVEDFIKLNQIFSDNPLTFQVNLEYSKNR